MKTEVVWSDRVPERDGIKSCVYDIAFRPDGSQIVVAVGMTDFFSKIQKQLINCRLYGPRAFCSYSHLFLVHY